MHWAAGCVSQHALGRGVSAQGGLSVQGGVCPGCLSRGCQPGGGGVCPSACWDTPPWTGLYANKNAFQVSSDDHQISVAGGRSHDVWVEGVLYSEVQCIMGNGHMGPSPPVTRQTPVKTLPSRKFVCGGN